VIDPRDLREVEREVGVVLAARDPSALPLLGHGEISLVLGWPPDDPTVACKRLPPFRDREAFDAYARVVRRYVDELRDGGVHVVDTEVHHLARDDGRVVGFHVQPVLPAELLGSEILRHGDAAVAHSFLAAVADTVVRVTHDRLGVDAQVTNWVWIGGEPWQLDLTTPFLLDEQRRPAFDLAPFLAMLPATVRPLVRREMVSLMRRWTTPRGSLLDMTANLLKERLDPWVDAALGEVNARVTPPVTRHEAAKIHESDKRLWPLLFKLERANRWWQEAVRRRPFDFLLPERTTYEELASGEPAPAWWPGRRRA
jgi:hypothetical protein